MTPKQKAEALVEKFAGKQLEILNKSAVDAFFEVEKEIAIECAKIDVNNIITELQTIQDRINLERKGVNYLESNLIYWSEVKQELEKL
ncbi:hypothetical protein CLU96_1264 [Chryseobacterium sp. 52]|uniref:hypothetical protein n=1 Tax=Chryseobacterium sp. 52 TaxID=2035213 RepID=UPI000C17DDD6|nr:hypothetical protein [Chryseobacterium sp. 52]PIF44321.1 hypothetical protein CLU96_1264 [Chryseobacterium sp. 52]